MANVLGSILVVLEAQTTAFAKGMRDARDLSFTTSGEIVASLQNIGAAFEKLKFGDSRQWEKSAQIAGGVFAGIAVAATAATLVITKEVAEQVKQLNKMSETFGIQIQTLTSYRVASTLTGVSMEQLGTGFRLLSRNALAAAEGGAKQTRTFSELGVSVTDAHGKLRPMNDLMLDMADKFSKMENGPQKVALAMGAFGRSGSALIPFLNQGRDGLEKLQQVSEQLGLTWGEQDTKSALIFQEQLELLDLKMDAFKENIAKGVLPALDGLSNAFLNTDVNGSNMARRIGGFVGDMMTGVAVTFEQLSYYVTKAYIALEQFNNMYEDTSVVNAWKNAMNDLEVDHEKFLAALGTPPAELVKHGGGDTTPPIEGKAGKAAKEAKEYESVMRSLASFLDRDDPFQKAAQHINELLAKIQEFKGKHPGTIFAEMNAAAGELNEQLRVLTTDNARAMEQLARGVVPGVPINPLGANVTGGMGQVPVSGKAATEAEQAQQRNGIDLNAERKRIYEETISPLERYNLEVSKLNTLYGDSDRMLPEYTRALEKYKDELTAQYDPSYRLRIAQQQLNDAYDAGFISLQAYEREKTKLNAQQAMDDTLYKPQSGMGGVTQGMSAGLKTLASEWNGLSNEIANATVNIGHNLSNAFSRGFTDMITGTKSVTQAFAQMGRDILGSIVQMLSQMLAQWVVHFITVAILQRFFKQSAASTEAATAAQSNFAQAVSAAFLGGANAYAAWAWNPPVAAAMSSAAIGVGLGMAATSFSAGMAGVAEKGAYLDQDMPIFAHAKEMILPQYLSDHIERTAGGGAAIAGAAAHSGGHKFEFHIHDANDPDEVADKVMTKVQRYFRTGGVMN